MIPIYEINILGQPYALDKYGFPSCDKERVGFYYEEETAVQAVEENWCSLQDHYARAAEIRMIEPGLYSNNKIIHYYLWNHDEQKFEESLIPYFEGFAI